MILVVGLGNPGKKYQNTRHNVGYMIIDRLEKEKTDDVVLFKPQGFMNESGKSVKSWIRLNYPMVALRRMYDDLLVIHDDIAISIGQFKIQKDRGAAGHKGAQSIIDELKTKDFWRIRVGICPKAGKPENVEKFVLQKFSKEEQGTLKKAIGEITLQLAELAQGKSKS